ncbi:MAG: DNA-binding response regulator [Chitinophagaceae bacterium]|nr:MAG: DNA-binding response regulator [Chitinophagaceae bacterium]
MVFILKWMQWKFLILDNSLDIYVGLIAIIFTILGIWIASQLTKPKTKIEKVVIKETVIVEKQVVVSQSQTFAPNIHELSKLGLTQREQEVLSLINLGKSNSEIASDLFLSLSTIKTHTSNLFFKLDVKSRTQAIEKAKRIGIIA